MGFSSANLGLFFKKSKYFGGNVYNFHYVKRKLKVQLLVQNQSYSISMQVKTFSEIALQR